MKKLKSIIIAVLLAVSGAVFACSKLGGDGTKLINQSDEQDNISEVSEESEAGAAEEDAVDIPAEQNKVFVHVCGAVIYPDVYEVDASSRVIDVIKLAGGFSDGAARDYLNLAGELTDGSKIYVPTVEEIESGEYAAFQPGLAEGINGVSSVIQGDSGKVNINTADADKLKTLNGIGDSRAGDIIKYREKNGAFKSVEDIKNVPGIKDSVFSKICDDIEV